MTDTNRPPLWWAMQGAYFSCRNPGLSNRHCYAAEIRALRDWLVPEQDKPNDEFCCPPVSTMLWRQKMDFRALLTAEADRAERGND